MRHTIKALGLIIAVLCVAALILPVTILFSTMKLLEGNNLGIQQPTINFSDGNFSIFIPYYINNTGFYDLSEINITIQLEMTSEKILKASSFLPNAPAGRKTDSSINFHFDIEELVSKCSELLTHDAELNSNVSIRLRVAYAITFETIARFMLPWGAPFYNLSVYYISYNGTHATFSISFDNHAQYSIRGLLKTEIYNSNNTLIGYDLLYVDASSGGHFEELLKVEVDPASMTPSGVIKLYFEDVKILEWIFS